MGDISASKTITKTTFAKSLFDSDLPSGWAVRVMGDVLNSTEYGLSEPASTAGDTPIVGMRDLVDGVVNLNELATIESGENDWSKFHLRQGDILLNRTNSPDLVGKIGYVREDSDAVFASYLVRLHVDSCCAESEYVAAWLNSDIAQRALKRLSTRGVSQSNLNPTEFRQHCPIPLPTLREQREIVEILRAWDKALEKLDALRAAKLKRHRWLTKALVFGTRQLGRFRGTEEVESYRWFQLPACWDCQPIGELAVEISERNIDGAQHDVLSCSKYDGFVRSLEYFKKQVFSADLSGYKKVWRGDFGFPSNHIEEGSIGLQNLIDVGVVSPIYTVFRFNAEEVQPEYAFAVLKTELYRHIFEVSTSASVDRRGSLRWSEFSRLPFPVPSFAEQEAIAEVLRNSQYELDSLSNEINAVSCQKRVLMQKLLTGEWRVEIN